VTIPNFGIRPRRYLLLLVALTVAAPGGGTMARLWHPNSKTEKFFGVVAHQLSSIRIVYRYSWRGGTPRTCRVVADLADPRKFDGEMLIWTKKKFPFPQIYHCVSDGVRIWWALPEVGANNKLIPGAWSIQYWPHGAPTGLPFTSFSGYAMGFIRNGLVPWSWRHRMELIHALHVGARITVTMRPAKAPRQLYRTYVVKMHSKLIAKMVMRLTMGRSLRIYSFRYWRRLHGRTIMVYHQWNKNFKFVNGAWIPTWIYDQRTAVLGAARLSPVTSVHILRVAVNPVLRPGQFRLLAPQGSSVFTNGPNKFTFVKYRYSNKLIIQKTGLEK
jgi:hypothetical protein